MITIDFIMVIGFSCRNHPVEIHRQVKFWLICVLNAPYLTRT